MKNDCNSGAFELISFNGRIPLVIISLVVINYLFISY